MSEYCADELPGSEAILMVLAAPPGTRVPTQTLVAPAATASCSVALFKPNAPSGDAGVPIVAFVQIKVPPTDTLLLEPPETIPPLPVTTVPATESVAPDSTVICWFLEM